MVKINPLEKLNVNNIDPGLVTDAESLVLQLFRKNKGKRAAAFINRLLTSYSVVKDKDVLVMHNPGGWGYTSIEGLIDWEGSIVEGVKQTLTRMGINWVLLQYFRSGAKWWNRFVNLPEQARYYFTGKFFKAKLLAAELNFLTEHNKNLTVFLLGVSQGAAFGNTVMKHVGNNPRIFSIELGTFFAYLRWRAITERTLILDGNGLVPDPIVHFKILPSAKSYVTAPFRWVKYHIQGKPAKFTYCINVPGHEYQWEFPNVGAQIEKFISASLGYKYNPEK